MPAINAAAYSAYTDMAFVAPEAALPAVIKQFSQDIDPKQMGSVGPTEAAIFRTPEGTPYIDVLSKKAPVVIDKNTKDYDTLKWEEELRAQLAQKKGQAKKLSADDQAKVNAQLAKEAAIRKEVAATEHRMRRGVGIIRSLATGPPTEAEQWMGPCWRWSSAGRHSRDRFDILFRADIQPSGHDATIYRRSSTTNDWVHTAC